MPLAKVKLVRTWSFSPCRSGDRKPSSLLYHMESLNADPKTLLLTLFLAQLPMEACSILTGSSTMDLNDFAKEVDAIMEVNSKIFSATGIFGMHNPMSSPTITMPKDMLLSHEVRQGGQEVQQGRVQVGIPHPIFRFHLLYHSLRKQAGQPKISGVGPGEKK